MAALQIPPAIAVQFETDRPRWYQQQKTPTRQLQIIHTQCRPRHRTRIRTRTRRVHIRTHTPRIALVAALLLLQCRENQRHHRFK